MFDSKSVPGLVDPVRERAYRRAVCVAHIRALQLSARMLLSRNPPYSELIERARHGHVG